MDKKWQKTSIISCILVALVILGLVFFVYTFRDEQKTIIPEEECPSTIAYWVGLPPLVRLAEDIPLIILGEVEDSSWESPKVKVTESLKGKYFNKGEVIDLCPGLLGLDLPKLQ